MRRLFLTLFVSLWPTLTLAQVVEPPPGLPPEAVAQLYLDEGYRLFEAGDYLQAATLFERAQALSPDPLNLRNIARCYDKAGQLDKALAFYNKHLDSKDTADRLAKSKADVVRIKGLLMGSLAVECPAETGEVELIGVVAPGRHACPHTWPALPRGKHVFELTRNGQRVYRGEAQVRPGQATRMNVILLPGEAAPTNGSEPTLGTGAAVEPASTWKEGHLWMLAGGAVAMGTGLGLHAANRLSFGELEDNPDNDALRSAVDRERELAFVSYGVGVALITGALVWWWTSD